MDTRQDAIDASDAYGNAGYTTATLTSPTKAQFTTARLQADILFFSGHGCPNYMEMGSGFYIYCQTGPVGTSHINLGTTVGYQDLVTFAGCNTAGGTGKDGTVYKSSITKRAAEIGAGVAVGWTEEVSAGSHTNWLRRYNDALAEGKTVSAAIDTANSYIYLPGSGVKSVKYYGDGSIRITSAKKTSSLDVGFTKISEDELFISENHSLITKINEQYSAKQKVYEDEEVISFMFENDKGNIVDIYFKSKGVITSISITLQIDKQGKIVEYKAHNLEKADKSSIAEQLSKISTQRATDRQKELVLLREQAKKQTTEQILSQKQFEYYDAENENTYIVTYTTVGTPNGAKYVLEDMTLLQ